jgi:hypothetical protein
MFPRRLARRSNWDFRKRHCRSTCCWQSEDKVIIWRTVTFPPQWVGTDIRWELSGGDGTSTVAFRHGTFADETEEGQVAYVWGQVMVQLKRYLETGVATPVFENS